MKLRNVYLLLVCLMLCSFSNAGNRSLITKFDDIQDPKTQVKAIDCSFKPVMKHGIYTRDQKQIQCVFNNHSGSIYSLYRRALRVDPSMQGVVELEFEITPEGIVMNPRISKSELNNPEFERKLIMKISRIRWPQMKGVLWSGVYPIDFVSKN